MKMISFVHVPCRIRRNPHQTRMKTSWFVAKECFGIILRPSCGRIKNTTASTKPCGSGISASGSRGSGCALATKWTKTSDQPHFNDDQILVSPRLAMTDMSNSRQAPDAELIREPENVLIDTPHHLFDTDMNWIAYMSRCGFYWTSWAI